MADPQPTPEELFQQGREELFTQIAHADGYDDNTRNFVKSLDGKGDLSSNWVWHRLGSLVFSVPSGETPNWSTMTQEQRELLAGRISALVDFAVTAATTPDERSYKDRHKPRELHDIMPEHFPDPSGPAQ